MSTIEVMLWIMFVLLISLLFFAAFGADKVSNQTIEEYMDNLVNEEQGSRGT
jgi:preprotein translocase subunit YajC